MDSPSNDPKLSLMALPSMDDDGLSQASPIGRFTPMLTPQTDLPHPSGPAIQGANADRPPKIHITLLSRKLVIFVLGTCVFLAAFASVAYHGVVVYHKTQSSKDDDTTKAVENKVELFNAISGFLIALVEVMLGVYMSNFLPAFQVYLHNMLWFLHGGVKATKTTNGVRSFLMFVFPVFLMLVIGQCLRSFQASQSSVGFKTVMLFDDMGLDESLTDFIKRSVDTKEEKVAASSEAANTTSNNPDRFGETVLRSAVNGSANPLNAMAPSACSTKRSEINIALTELDSTNVAFGFPPQEWYSEMLDVMLNSTGELYTFRDLHEAYDSQEYYDPPNFDLVVASDMYAAAKSVLDRMVAESTTFYTECEGFADMDLFQLAAAEEMEPQLKKCSAAYRTLIEVGNFQADPAVQRVEDLGIWISFGLSLAVDGLDVENTTITFGRANITDQVDTETMTIDADIAIDPTDSPFFTSEEEGHYTYGKYAQDLCGATDCVFIDPNNGIELPRQVIIVPYQKNCKYTSDSIKYVRDVRSFMPSDCEAQPNSALVISITSFITAAHYTSDMSKRSTDDPATPGLINPVRRMRMTITKINWKPQDLTAQFADEGVQCRRSETDRNCSGLSYRLTKTGRFVFVGEDSIPNKEIMAASLAVPIRLVQLNAARFYMDGLTFTDENKTKVGLVTPERLAWAWEDHYEDWDWMKELANDECSSYMDAYINHIERNALYLELQEEVLYRAAMFYLFSKASVTEVDSRDLAIQQAINDTASTTTAELLNNLKLKGDIQYRDVLVKVPTGTFIATAVGCGVLLLIAIVIVLFPKRPMEYFAPTVTTPDKFIVLKNSVKYPDVVHTKTLLFPASGEALPMDDFDVDEMTLVNRMDQSDELKFWDWSR